MTPKEYTKQLEQLREKRRRAIARHAPDFIVAQYTQEIARLQVEQFHAMRSNGKA
jgi:hypothetical protein